MDIRENYFHLNTMRIKTRSELNETKNRVQELEFRYEELSQECDRAKKELTKIRKSIDYHRLREAIEAYFFGHMSDKIGDESERLAQDLYTIIQLAIEHLPIMSDEEIFNLACRLNINIETYIIKEKYGKDEAD